MQGVLVILAAATIAAILVALVVFVGPRLRPRGSPVTGGAPRFPPVDLWLVDRQGLADEPGLREYFAGFGSGDLVARGASGVDHARERYLGAVLDADIGPDRAAALADLVAEADARMMHMGDIQDIPNIPRTLRESARVPGSPPWRIALLADGAEGGWPHTHGGVVCLPLSMLEAARRARSPATDAARDALVRTLVHERVHVLQRLRPAEALRAVTGGGMTPHGDTRTVLGRLPGGPGLVARLRSNPDLDGRLYAAPGRPGVVTVSLFPPVGPVGGPSRGPSGGLGASRVTLVNLTDGAAGEETPAPPGEHEHPYEAMAYAVAARA